MYFLKEFIKRILTDNNQIIYKLLMKIYGRLHKKRLLCL
jgi:hypothetical protein